MEYYVVSPLDIFIVGFIHILDYHSVVPVFHGIDCQFLGVVILSLE